MSDEILNRIEKHMEGTQLGLAALSEVLQKMDARIEAEDDASYEIAKEEEAQLEKEELIHDIAKAVLIELAENPLGMDVDGTEAMHEEEDEKDEVKKLYKQISSLQKQIESLDISKAVKDESENRLRKMGFKEENGLQKPELSNVFGADETPIKKAQTVNDVVDQLTNLSYKELRKMQEFKRQGLTENLPDEIANL